MLRADEALCALADQDRALPTDELVRRMEGRLLAESPTIPRVVGSTSPPRVRARWRRPGIVLVAAALATLALVGGVALLAFPDGGDVVDEPPVTPTVPSPIAPSTTVPTTSLPPPSLAPIPALPAPAEPTSTGPPVAAGYDCGHVAGLGYDYAATLAYWVREGRPSRMDDDGNGIPCEAAYPADQVDAVLHFDATQPTDDVEEGSGDGGPLGSGMWCADLADLGYGYVPALAYWVREGAPARMDTNGNGLPCETVYEWAEIEAVIGFDGASFRSLPAQPAGWSPTMLATSVVPACCGANAAGPVSPPLPPATDGFPHDGEYSTEVERVGSSLTLQLRRWIPCSAAPDQCLEPKEGDVTADRSEEFTTVLRLDSDLTVVLHPISMPDGTAVAGDGTALAEFLATLDEAYDLWLGPAAGLSCFEPEKLPTDATGCPFVPLWDPNGMVAYRGPLGSYLVMLPELAQWSENDVWPRGPGDLYGWETAFVISDGRPILHIGAGRIAG